MWPCRARKRRCRWSGSAARGGSLVNIVKGPAADEQAESEKRHHFAVRANSILAFVECSEELRPKLRDAIVEAMLWAQTQP